MTTDHDVAYKRALALVTTDRIAPERRPLAASVIAELVETGKLAFTEEEPVELVKAKDLQIGDDLLNLGTVENIYRTGDGNIVVLGPADYAIFSPGAQVYRVTA